VSRGPKRASRSASEGALFPSQALAKNVKAWRRIRELSQVELASRMSALGLDWTEGTVGFVERYQRSVTIDEFVGLTICLSLRIGELIDPTGPYLNEALGLDFAGSGWAVLDARRSSAWARSRIKVEYSGGEDLKDVPRVSAEVGDVSSLFEVVIDAMRSSPELTSSMAAKAKELGLLVNNNEEAE
jgi:hypothetical protein